VQQLSKIVEAEMAAEQEAEDMAFQESEAKAAPEKEPAEAKAASDKEPGEPNAKAAAEKEVGEAEMAAEKEAESAESDGCLMPLNEAIEKLQALQDRITSSIQLLYKFQELQNSST